MTVSKAQPPTDLDLMMYADGELAGDEARAVAAWIEQHPEARAKVDSVRQVGDYVRTYVELETDRAEVDLPAFGDMWSRIERRIHSNGHGERDEAAAPAAQPSRTPARESAAPRHRTPASPGLWATIRGWFEDHRGHVLTGALSAGAVAALMLAVGPRERVIQRTVVNGSAGVVVGGGTPAALESQPPEVEDLEVYEGSGTILTIDSEGDDDSAAAVIWISNDEEDNTEDPI